MKILLVFCQVASHFHSVTSIIIVVVAVGVDIYN